MEKKDNQEWKCPIDEIDADIREVVKTLLEHGFRPFQSCSGSYKDHRERSAIPSTGLIEILDSEFTRNLIANLSRDKRFCCGIVFEGTRQFYGNKLPEGFRFSISFENIEGNMQDELLSIIQKTIDKSQIPNESRNQVDRVCSVLRKFNVKYNNTIGFVFNDPMLIEGKENEENYSIVIYDRKDSSKFKEYVGELITGIEENSRYGRVECIFYGNNFESMWRALQNIQNNYNKVPVLRGATAKYSTAETRHSIFAIGHMEKTRRAQRKLEDDENERLLKDTPVDLLDLLGKSIEKDEEQEER